MLKSVTDNNSSNASCSAKHPPFIMQRTSPISITDIPPPSPTPYSPPLFYTPPVCIESLAQHTVLDIVPVDYPEQESTVLLTNNAEENVSLTIGFSSDLAIKNLQQQIGPIVIHSINPNSDYQAYSFIVKRKNSPTPNSIVYHEMHGTSLEDAQSKLQLPQNDNIISAVKSRHKCVYQIHYSPKIKIAIPYPLTVSVGPGDRINGLDTIAQTQIQYGHLQYCYNRYFAPFIGTSLSQHTAPYLLDVMQDIITDLEILDIGYLVHISHILSQTPLSITHRQQYTHLIFKYLLCSQEYRCINFNPNGIINRLHAYYPSLLFFLSTYAATIMIEDYNEDNFLALFVQTIPIVVVDLSQPNHVNLANGLLVSLYWHFIQNISLLISEEQFQRLAAPLLQLCTEKLTRSSAASPTTVPKSLKPTLVTQSEDNIPTHLNGLFIDGVRLKNDVDDNGCDSDDIACNWLV